MMASRFLVATTICTFMSACSRPNLVQLSTATSVPNRPTIHPPTMEITATSVPSPLPATQQATAEPMVSTPILSQPTEIGRLGKGYVLDIAWSSDGKLVAVASSVGVSLYATSTWNEVIHMSPRGGGDWVAFDPTGELLAIGNLSDGVTLWETESGRVASRLEVDPGWTTSASFSHDGRWLAFIMAGQAQLWDTVTGKLTATLQEGETPDVGDWGRWPDSLSFSWDDQVIAVAFRDGRVQLWDIPSSQVRRTLVSYTTCGESALDIAFSPMDSVLVATCAGNPIQVWHTNQGALLHSLSAYAFVGDRPFSPDGKQLVLLSREGSLEFWDVASERVLQALELPPDRELFRLSADWSNYAVLTAEGDIQVWETASNRSTIAITGYTFPVDDFDISPDDTLLASATNGVVQLWDLSNGLLIQALQASSRRVEGVSFSPDGQYLASIAGVPDNTIWLWDTESYTKLRSFDGHSDLIFDIAFSPDSGFLVSGGFDGTLRLWDVQTGRAVLRFDVQDRPVRRVAFSPTGQSIAAILGGYSVNVEIFDTSSGQTLQRVPLSGADSIAFSPDGSLLAVAGGEDRSLRVWDFEADALRYRIELFDGVPDNQSVAAPLAFNPDGTLLAVGDRSGFWLVDVASGTLLSSLEVHTGDVTAMSFNSVGGILASSSWDGTIRLWEVK
jgi:WD40 repeat protein